MPKISKGHDLKNHRRFTLTDPGGDTIFIGTPLEPGTGNFYRTLQNEKYAKKFAVLYDVVYSKEDAALAARTLPNYGINKDLLDDLDKAKFLLLMLEIQHALGQPIDGAELKALLDSYQDRNYDWVRIRKRYSAILEEQ